MMRRSWGIARRMWRGAGLLPVSFQAALPGGGTVAVAAPAGPGPPGPPTGRWAGVRRQERRDRARRRLHETGYGEVQVRTGDGYRGWPEEAPFDAILVTAAPDAIPDPLLQQLKPGGRLVVPVGTGTQELLRVTRTASG